MAETNVEVDLNTNSQTNILSQIGYIIMKISSCKILIITAVFLFVGMSFNGYCQVTEQYNLLFSSIDDSFDNLVIRVNANLLFSKDYFNQRELKVKDDIINRVRPLKQILEYIPKVTDKDVSQQRDIQITLSSGKMLVQQTVEGSLIDEDGFSQTVFYEPGKYYTIDTDNIETGQKKMNVRDVFGYFSSFGPITAHTFGRGLKYFSGYDIELSDSQEESETHIINFFHPDSKQLKARAVIDSSKGYCWKQLQLFNDGKLISEYNADDFTLFNGIWIPFRITTTRFSLVSGEWDIKKDIQIKDISALSDTRKELSIFDQITPDTLVSKID